MGSAILMEGSGNWIMDGAAGTFFHTEGAVLGGR